MHSPVTNKLKRFKFLRYHAKGKSGRAKHDISQIKITLVEKPIKELYKDIMRGRGPPVLAYKLKQELLD